MKQAIVAVRALDKGLAAATDPEMKEALEEARSTIAAVVATTGVVLKAARAESANGAAAEGQRSVPKKRRRAAPSAA